MRRLAVVLAFMAAPLGAQTYYTAATRPACTNNQPREIFIRDATAQSDCTTTGGGAFEAHCCCQDGTWAACATFGVAPSSSNSFETIDLDAGTDPVADSATDTLTVDCTAPLVCTGTAASDLWVFSWTSTPLVAADIDTSSEIRAIVSDEAGTGALLFSPVAAADIASDAVTESKLKAVNSPVDEYYLTYESTTGDFEWQATAGGGASGEYDPNRPPSSGLDTGASDEYFNSINTGIYTLGNSPSVSAEIDKLRLDISATASRDRKVIWYPLPGSGDWTFSTKIYPGLTDAMPTTALTGIAALVTGTTGSPTLIEMCIEQRGATVTAIAMYNSTSYTATYNNVLGAGNLNMQHGVGGIPIFLRYRFVDSSNNLLCDYSEDGIAWDNISTRTSLANNPTYIGLFGDDNTANTAFSAYFEFARTCTSGACVATPWPIGE